MALSNVSLTQTFLEWLNNHNGIIVELNRMLEGIYKSTGNVTITNTISPGNVALNVANGLIKGDGGLLTNIANTIIIGTWNNDRLQNTGLTIIFGSGLDGDATANLGGEFHANLTLSRSVANTATNVGAAANTVNSVHDIAIASSAGTAAAFGKANIACTQADVAGTLANTVYSLANTAITQSDSAGAVANNAFGAANLKFTRVQVLNVDSGFTWSNTSLFLAAQSNTGNAIRIVRGSGANISVDATNNAIRIGTFGFGKKKLWIPATAMYPRSTNGATVGSVETTTNKNVIRTMDFDPSTQQFAQFSISMPKIWNEGTVTFAPHWSHANTQTNFGVVFALQAVAISDGDNFDVAFGSEQTSGDTGTANNRLFKGPESSAITIAGSPQSEDLVLFQIKRNPGDASDTLGVDARLHGIDLFITTNGLTED
jgi:hypothetical protein